MNIKKFAAISGLTPRAIRFYEEKGILRSVRDPENKYRVYGKDDIVNAQRILQFRQMGFSIAEIETMLKSSPELNVTAISKNIEKNIEKLQNEMNSIQKQIRDAESLLTASRKMKPLTSRQKKAFKNVAFSDLNSWTLQYAEDCLKKKKLGHDEELQMLACAYADLVLKAANQGELNDLGNSHKLIAKCLTKIKESNLSSRHLKTSKAYFNMARDPNWTPPAKNKNI
ncbi:MerR family transcriptional regulator [Bdellovibrio sp. HCB274]|uniref:MerR family transcriptional regulator n=1 Tax=Bdellovibrio sp. HCB274 TaxID=3394361 RepID=UPI0039B366B8